MSGQGVLRCLDDEAIAAFIAGALSAADLIGVEAHLASCAACSQIAATVARMASDASGSFATQMLEPGSTSAIIEALGARNVPPLLARGDVVSDKYRIEERIGSGGMSEVFSAYHVELGHRVALKVLQRADADTSVRFLREAQTCARLRNDHLVQVFDIGRLSGGAPYLVMEYLMGEDLAHALARGPLEPALAVEYILQAGVAVRAAHAAGIVHRDLKPANLFLATRQDEPPRLKVLDFGISKYLHGSTGGATETLPGVIIGSPSYMSPEQWISAEDTDARSDIWSLGVILYEALTGRLPFRSETFAELGMAIAGGVPGSPSEGCPDLPTGLEVAVLRCLRKDPNERFQSVADFMESIAPFAGVAVRRSAEHQASVVAAAPLSDSHLTALTDWEVYEETADYVFAGWSSVYVVIWHRETSAAAVQRCAQHGRRLARKCGHSVGVLSIIEAQASLPSGEARRAIVDTFTGASFVHCSAVVFEGAGFWASAVRSVVTGLNLAARPIFPHRPCTLAEAAMWFARTLPAHTGRPFSKDDFLSAVAALRASSRAARSARS